MSSRPLRSVQGFHLNAPKYRLKSKGLLAYGAAYFFPLDRVPLLMHLNQIFHLHLTPLNVVFILYLIL